MIWGEGDMETYSIQVKCLNCGRSCCPTIKKGTQVQSVDCPNCGCNRLTVDDSECTYGSMIIPDYEKHMPITFCIPPFTRICGHE